MFLQCMTFPRSSTKYDHRYHFYSYKINKQIGDLVKFILRKVWIFRYAIIVYVHKNSMDFITTNKNFTPKQLTIFENCTFNTDPKYLYLIL